MRVKTAPRHRIIQNDTRVESTSENFTVKFDDGEKTRSKNEEKRDTLNYTADKCKVENSVKFEQQEDSSVSDEEKDENLNYTNEVLDMSNKCKVEPLHKTLLDHCLPAGPSNSKYSESPPKEDKGSTSHNDDNNNALPLNAHLINSHSMAGPSSGKYPKLFQLKEASVNDDTTMKAVNLSKKDSQEDVKEESSSASTISDDRLKDTFLYKIMTDPTFLESIQKNKKQPRKHVCQFCKQEFNNSDELADHMDVKKDESNQVVCCACKKTFAQKRYLRYHQRCHSERAKFTCDICTKKYTRLDNLTRHNAFHVNPDKFSCTSCERTFARKDLLNKHLKCHDNKYRFFCETCQKYFKGPLTLDIHNKIFHTVA